MHTKLRCFNRHFLRLTPIIIAVVVLSGTSWAKTKLRLSTKVHSFNPSVDGDLQVWRTLPSSGGKMLSFSKLVKMICKICSVGIYGSRSPAREFINLIHVSFDLLIIISLFISSSPSLNPFCWRRHRHCDMILRFIVVVKWPSIACHVTLCFVPIVSGFYWTCGGW